MADSKKTLFDSDYLPRYRKRIGGNAPYSLIFDGDWQHCDGVGLEPILFTELARSELGIYEGSRTEVAGPLKLSVAGRTIDVERQPGFQIPDWIEDDNLRFKTCGASALLIVDHHVVFKALCASEAWMLLDCVLVCSVGIPRASGRRFLHRISKHFKLGAYWLSDNSTWSYFAFSLLKRGLSSPGESCEFLAVPNIRYIGLRASDDVNAAPRDKWRPYWSERLRCLRRYPCFQTPAWQIELRSFEKQKHRKFLWREVAERGGGKFAEEYLLRKIKTRDWLA